MINVLIYTEDAKQLHFLKEVLSRKVDGVMLSVIKNPDEALAAAAKTTVDMLIADLQVVRKGKACISGLDFLESFRDQQRNRYTPVVVMSDLEDKKYYFYYRLHCFGFFTKPLNKELFLSEIIPLCRYLEKMRKWREFYQDTVYFLKCRKELLMIRERELIRFELHTKRGLVVTMDGEYEVDAASLREEKRLTDSLHFIRCNRSDYVNRDFIREVGYSSVRLDGEYGRIYLTSMGRKNLERYLRDI